MFTALGLVGRLLSCSVLIVEVLWSSDVTVGLDIRDCIKEMGLGFDTDLGIESAVLTLPTKKQIKISFYIIFCVSFMFVDDSVLGSKKIKTNIKCNVIALT